MGVFKNHLVVRALVRVETHQPFSNDYTKHSQFIFLPLYRTYN